MPDFVFKYCVSFELSIFEARVLSHRFMIEQCCRPPFRFGIRNSTIILQQIRLVFLSSCQASEHAVLFGKYRFSILLPVRHPRFEVGISLLFLLITQREQFGCACRVIVLGDRLPGGKRRFIAFHVLFIDRANQL